MPTTTTEEIKELHQVVAQLHAEVAKVNSDRDKIDRLNAFLDKQELKNQEFVVAQQEAKARENELKEQIQNLEIELSNRGSAVHKSYKESPEVKALIAFIVSGKEGMKPEQKAVLRTDVDTQGGYLAPVEFDSNMIKTITEVSPIRRVSRVRRTSAKALEIAVRNTIPTAAFEGETEAGGDSTSTYKKESLTPIRQTFSIPITSDMLMDGAFDMESELMVDALEAFAQSEGAKFVSGSGHKEPEGFLTNTAVIASPRTSSVSASLNADDVINLTGDLKEGYNPTYAMNRGTLAFIRTLKSTDGVFLWQPGLNGAVSNTLNGYPYIIAQDMPALASNALPIVFADFGRGYTIVDRAGLVVVRDEYTLKKQAIVEFTFSRWVTGQVTLAEAFKVLKCAA